MPSSACKKSALRSEEHTSELQSHDNLVCRLLLENTSSASDRRSGFMPFSCIWRATRPEAFSLHLARDAHGELLAGFEQDLAGFGFFFLIDGRLPAEPVGRQRHAPAF